MSDQPQTWHYGIIAGWWAEFNIGGEDIAYFQNVIEEAGQPALDISCGAGRLLLPYLRAGLDVDGLDISGDMLAHCRAKAEQEGLTARLYQQPVHAMDLPRTYKTIFICDSFGIGGERSRDIEAFRRIYRHLMPGGALVFNHYLPTIDVERWPYWLREQRRQLPHDWPPPGERRRAANGDEYALRARLVALDPLEQRMTLQMHAELWREGSLVAEEERTLLESLYFRNELLLMLEKAGFGDVTVRGGYTERVATVEDEMLVFIARKE